MDTEETKAHPPPRRDGWRYGVPRLVRLQRPFGAFGTAFQRGDILVVLPGACPEGGEIVIDMAGRVGRHGGGPVRGVVVGAVRRRALEPPEFRKGANPAPL